MNRAAYELTGDLPKVINISGGRSSAYMTYHILEAYGGYEYLPADTLIVFCNTGKEYPQTYDFVQRCSDEWQAPILWLEYQHRPDARGRLEDPRHTYRIVNYDTAARKGEPFRAFTRAKRRLPNVAQRLCTFYLKTEPVRWFVQRVLKWKRYTSFLGMRYDEPKRINKALFEHCAVEYPLYYAQTTKADVMAFWQHSRFDLNLDPDKSNCDLCFLKGLGVLLPIITEDPSVADWWIEQEEELSAILDHHDKATFNKRISYAELREYALTGVNPRDGQIPLFNLLDGLDEGPQVDCFCGD